MDDSLGELNDLLRKPEADRQADHAFFVFGDLNIKVVGQFQLRFTLFEMHKRYLQQMNVKHGLTSFRDNGDFHVMQLGSILTNTFKGLQYRARYLLQANNIAAYAPKDFPGQMESTQLSKQLCDQGIKLRIRKETRFAQLNRS